MAFTNPNSRTAAAMAAAMDPRPSGMTIGRFGDYREAQRAVDYLSDEHFPVEHTTIVGKDLQRVEKITGRLTSGRAAGLGAGSGAYVGAFFGILLGLFAPQGTNFFLVLIAGIIIGLIGGALFGVIGYRLSGGRRDFTSSTVVIATTYDVLCDHRYAQDARDHLSKLAMSGEVHPLPLSGDAAGNQPGGRPDRPAEPPLSRADLDRPVPPANPVAPQQAQQQQPQQPQQPQPPQPNEPPAS